MFEHERQRLLPTSFDGLRLMGHQSTFSQLRCLMSNEQRLLLCVAMLQLLAWQSQQIHVGSDCCPQADVLRLLEHQPHRQAAFVASADVLQLMGRQASLQRSSDCCSVLSCCGCWLGRHGRHMLAAIVATTLMFCDGWIIRYQTRSVCFLS